LVLGHLVLFIVLVITTAAVLCGHRSKGRIAVWPRTARHRH